MAPSHNHVAEMQGLYGPFTMAERVVQKIWLRGDFDSGRAVLADGRPLRIRTPGRWNLLGGPDFHGARLVVGGGEIVGDVEVHFHAADWRAHGHAGDRAYDRVALHVVMFPPAAGEPPTVGFDGRPIPVLALLPLLHRDLEEYASDDALEGLTARDDWEHFAELAAMPADEVAQLLQRQAEARWRQKVRFARLRIDRLGWAGAAHHTALEILGYRHNRAPMLTVAVRYPLAAWTTVGVAPEALLAEEGIHWQTQGVRPANHPLARLRQYQRWTTAVPDWPDRLPLFLRLPLSPLSWGTPTRPTRQAMDLGSLRETVAIDVLGGVVGGTRLDNLVCDGFLPLLAAQTGADRLAAWFHWFLGDVPFPVRTALPKLGVAGRDARPHCHGWAQGLLGWLLEREARASG